MATQKEIAGHLDLSDRRVRSLIKEGILPGSKGSGGLSLTDCRLAYIRHIRGVASGQIQSSEELELNQEKALLAREQRRKAQRENDLADNLIAPVSMISDTIIKAGAIIMSNLESLPAMIKRENPELTAHDINTVRKCIHKCCQAISESRIDMRQPEIPDVGT